MAAPRAAAQQAHRAVLLLGDGVGPEIVGAAVAVLERSGARPFDWLELPYGGGAPLDPRVLDAFDDRRLILKGPLTISPADANVRARGRSFTSSNQALRKLFGLYANVRPARSLPPGLGLSPFRDIDMVVVRENTEDVYTGEERWTDPDTVECIKRITRGASRRVAAYACALALQRPPPVRLTICHKANVCKESDGLFLSEARSIAAQHAPHITCDDQLADSLLTSLVQRPHDYNIILCPNLFGDLVSDLAAGLIGSLGLMGSGQFGEQHALFEPAHGSAPAIAGKGVANPTSMLRCAVMLLHHVGEAGAALRVQDALEGVLEDAAKTKARGGRLVTLTPDMGGEGGTRDMVDAVLERL